MQSPRSVVTDVGGGLYHDLTKNAQIKRKVRGQQHYG